MYTRTKNKKQNCYVSLFPFRPCHCTVLNLMCRVKTRILYFPWTPQKGRGLCSSVPNVSLALNNLKTGTCLSWLCCAIPAGGQEETCFLSSSLCTKLCCKIQNVKVKIKTLLPEKKTNKTIKKQTKPIKSDFVCLLRVIQQAHSKFLFLLIIALKQMTFMVPLILSSCGLKAEIFIRRCIYAYIWAQMSEEVKS